MIENRPPPCANTNGSRPTKGESLQIVKIQIAASPRIRYSSKQGEKWNAFWN
jgi:hypothetical protein